MASTGFWRLAPRTPSASRSSVRTTRHAPRASCSPRANRIAHGLRALGPAQRRHRARPCCPTGSRCSSCTSPRSRSGCTSRRSTTTWSAPRSPTSSTTATPRCSSTTSGSPTSGQAAADEIDFPTDRRFAVGAVDGFRPSPSSLTASPTTAARGSHRRRGHALHVGHHRTPEGREARASPTSTPTTWASCSTCFQRCSASSPRDDNVHITGSPLYHTAVLHVDGATPCTWATPSCSWTSGRPRRCCELIDQHGVTTSPHGADPVPPPARRCPTRCGPSTTCPRLRHMVHAAAPCPPEIKRRMIEWWGDAIEEYYAATEGGGTIIIGQGVARQARLGRLRGPARRSASSTTTGSELPPGTDRHRVHGARHGRLRVQGRPGQDRPPTAATASSPSATSASSTRTATCSCATARAT